VNPIDDYPRPQLRRAEWTSLDGPWDFALDQTAAWSTPDEVAWDRTIVVPFAPETPASGIGETGFTLSCWYRRAFDPPPLTGDERLLLHFGAVDHTATVWINDRLAATHEGGYTPFTVDVTGCLQGMERQTITVRAEDDPADLTKPRGKQDWQLEPHAIWYPRTTGIWQTVWLERVGATRIDTLRWSFQMDAWDIGLEALIEEPGVLRSDLHLGVRLSVTDETGAERLLADDTYRVVAGEVHRRIALSDPGIDDFRNELLWSPEKPTLVRAEVRLEGPDGALLDEVSSYLGLRSVGVQGDRFILNGRPFYLRMVLDQGYWPESGLTAPTPDALRRDIELAKAMGFNGVRKHQKLEDPRYLFWADRLGLMVWEEMPSAYRYTTRSVGRVTREWNAALLRDVSHPCIVAWVPINESWGVPDLPNNPSQRDYVQALYYLTRTIDPSRPVIGNDGWESVATDIIGIHDYAADPKVFVRRYGSAEEIPNIFRRERPNGRLLTIDGFPHAGQPLMLTEFGGVALNRPDRDAVTWGYARSETAERFAEQYRALVETVQAIPLLAGFCYTQFADTYQEANGLLYADRTPKLPLEEIAAITRGSRSAFDLELERYAQSKETQADASSLSPATIAPGRSDGLDTD